MRVEVVIHRRPEIADPQGTTVLRALRDLGYGEVTAVRFDKVITLEVDGGDQSEVEKRVVEMCERLLANPVIEDFEVVIPSTGAQPR
jgi:phosphoribosylformylglycinamidine synthase